MHTPDDESAGSRLSEPSISGAHRCRAISENRCGRVPRSARTTRDRRRRRHRYLRNRREPEARGADRASSRMMRPARSGHCRRVTLHLHCRDRSTTISGGEPNRIGNDEHPRPPETIRWRPLFDLVPIKIARAEARRHNRRIAENANLAAVRVACNRQRNAVRDLWKNIRLMRHQDHGRIVRHLLQRARKIIDADVIRSFRVSRIRRTRRPLAPEGPLVAEARNPERLAVFLEPHDVVLVNWDADGLERQAGAGRSRPPPLYD